MGGKHRILVSLAVCLLLSLSAVVGASGLAASGLQCNDFLPSDHYGVMTDSCDEADDLASELLSEGGNVGVMGGLRQVNDTINGRFTTFRLDKNGSMFGYSVWVNGSMNQIFDAIVFNDATSVNASIEGALFNGSFGNALVNVHNNPTGLLRIEAERSSSIKFTMTGGIFADVLDEDEVGNGSVEAATIGGRNLSSTIWVKGGTLESAGNRSLMVNLARGGEVIFRVGADASSQQKDLLRAFPAQEALTEYWVVSRDDGALYDFVAYDDISLGSDDATLKMGDWRLPLPAERGGKLVLLHTDRLSVTQSGGIESILAVNGDTLEETGSLDEVVQAASEKSSTGLFFMEQRNNRVDVYMYFPAEATTPGGEPGDDQPGDDRPSGDSGADSPGSIDGAMLLPILLGAGIIVVVGAAIWAVMRRRQ